jgi:hypothetical protein
LFGFLIVVAAVDSDWPGIKEARQQCVAKYAINSSISNTQRGREKIKRFGLQEMTGKRRRRRKKRFCGASKKEDPVRRQTQERATRCAWRIKPW